MDKIVTLLNELGLPFSYDHFTEGESPEPPFVCYLIPGTDHFAADGRVYAKISVVHVELYTDKKDPELEERIESIFDSHEIVYDRSEVWIASEKLYEVLYSFEMEA